MSPLRAARPQDTPNSHHFILEDQSRIMQVPEPSPITRQNRGLFFPKLVTSLYIPGCGEPRGSLASAGPHNGWESGEGARIRPWLRLGERIRWERVSGPC